MFPAQSDVLVSLRPPPWCGGGWGPLSSLCSALCPVTELGTWGLICPPPQPSLSAGPVAQTRQLSQRDWALVESVAGQPEGGQASGRQPRRRLVGGSGACDRPAQTSRERTPGGRVSGLSAGLLRAEDPQGFVLGWTGPPGGEHSVLTLSSRPLLHWGRWTPCWGRRRSEEEFAQSGAAGARSQGERAKDSSPGQAPAGALPTLRLTSSFAKPWWTPVPGRVAHAQARVKNGAPRVLKGLGRLGRPFSQLWEPQEDGVGGQ